MVLLYHFYPVYNFFFPQATSNLIFSQEVRTGKCYFLIFFLSKEGLTKREKLTSDYQECFTGQMYLNFKDLNTFVFKYINTNVFKI